MKCAVITTVAPGDELFALDSEDSVAEARAGARSPFAEVVHFKIAEHAGEPSPGEARNRGVEMAAQAGAEWVFFLDARDVLCKDAFSNVANMLAGYDAIWGCIYDLADDERSGRPRPGQLVRISGIEQVLANDPLATLGGGYFVRTRLALATPCEPRLGYASIFDNCLRLWSKHRCVKIEAPFSCERGVRAAASASERRAAVESVICAHCEALDFRAEFTYRGEHFRFAVANPFDLIHANLLKGRFFEQPELNFIEEWVGAGASIVEAGAYVGNHVVYYARFMQPRRVLVLEPNPEAIALLRRNLADNGVRCADVSRLGIGVAAAPGSYDLVSTGTSNRGATRLVAAGAGAIVTAPLDDLTEDRIDFMKIDVEGMEFEVLEGAARAIARSRPKIMVEVFRPQIPRFSAWMKAHRYREARRFENVYAVNYCIETANG